MTMNVNENVNIQSTIHFLDIEHEICTINSGYHVIPKKPTNKNAREINKFEIKT